MVRIRYELLSLLPSFWKWSPEMLFFIFSCRFLPVKLNPVCVCVCVRARIDMIFSFLPAQLSGLCQIHGFGLCFTPQKLTRTVNGPYMILTHSRK